MAEKRIKQVIEKAAAAVTKPITERKNPPAPKPKPEEQGKNKNKPPKDILPGEMLRTWPFWLCFGMVLLAAPTMLLFSPVIVKLGQERGLSEGAALYARLASGSNSLADAVDRLREAFPGAQEWLARYGYDAARVKAELSRLALSLGGLIAKNTVAFGGGAAHFLTNLALVLYISFFLVRDGERLKKLLIRALPFGDHREERLFRKFAGVMRATVKGSLLVAMAQGALGGLIFWALDIRAAVLWGVVMTLLSLIPVVGAALVWGPTALYLLATGFYWQGGILIAYGACVIGLADNLLRPVLVGRDTKLPDFMVLLSTLGGFMMFGMDGFVTGPTLAVLFVTVWQIFMEECGTDSCADLHRGEAHGESPVEPAVPAAPERSIPLCAAGEEANEAGGGNKRGQDTCARVPGAERNG